MNEKKNCNVAVAVKVPINNARKMQKHGIKCFFICELESLYANMRAVIFFLFCWRKCERIWWEFLCFLEGVWIFFWYKLMYLLGWDGAQQILNSELVIDDLLSQEPPIKISALNLKYNCSNVKNYSVDYNLCTSQS